MSKISLTVSYLGAVKDTFALAAYIKKGRFAVDPDDGGLTKEGGRSSIRVVNQIWAGVEGVQKQVHPNNAIV